VKPISCALDCFFADFVQENLPFRVFFAKFHAQPISTPKFNQKTPQQTEAFSCCFLPHFAAILVFFVACVQM
jgi:hypothetical protein